MIRLLVYAAIACVLCRVFTRQWPWQLAGWNLPRREPGSRSARSADEALARALLGVAPGASRNDILEAHKRLVAIVHPDRGGTGEQVHEANAARDLLLARLTETLE